MYRIQTTDLDVLAFTLDFNHDSIERALRQTAAYVSEHQLMLTGGTAIDMALRMKGTFLYDDNALPDYDIVSNENLHHATQLAKILCDQGFQDINVINAIHVTTVRVRIKNVTLLDATYVPKNLIDRIPFIDVESTLWPFRIVHPNYQKIDQRLSMSALMMDTGASLNIFNRLVKDVNRNALLRNWFNLNDQPRLNETELPQKMKRATIQRIAVTNQDETYEEIGNGFFIDTGDACISSFSAYALYYHEFCKTHDLEEQSGIINPNVHIDDERIEFDIPSGSRVSILNCNDRAMEVFMAFQPNGKFHKFNPLLNVKPAGIRGEDYEVLDTYGRRIGACLIDDVVIACVDYLLMEFLRDVIFGDEALKETNIAYHQSLLRMIEISSDEVGENGVASVWMPTISCYGYEMLPEYKAMSYERLLNAEAASSLKPKNSYLRIPECRVKAEFDHSESHYFSIDGLQNDSLEHTNLKWTRDKIQLGEYEIQ